MTQRGGEEVPPSSAGYDGPPTPTPPQIGCHSSVAVGRHGSAGMAPGFLSRERNKRSLETSRARSILGLHRLSLTDQLVVFLSTLSHG